MSSSTKTSSFQMSTASGLTSKRSSASRANWRYRFGGQRERVPEVSDIKRVLEEAGIEFIPANGGGVGVRFKNPT